jgi:hypothetical protein
MLRVEQATLVGHRILSRLPEAAVSAANSRRAQTMPALPWEKPILYGLGGRVS